MIIEMGQCTPLITNALANALVEPFYIGSAEQDLKDKDLLGQLMLSYLPEKKRKLRFHTLDININGGTVANPVLPKKDSRIVFNSTIMDFLKRYGVEDKFTGRVQMQMAYAQPTGSFKVIRSNR